jgi:outer membrane protein assembly factor BamD
MTMFRFGSIARILSFVLLVAAAGACGGKKEVLPKGAQPDKFLFDKGTASLSDKHWLTAREYFRRIIDSYPQSNYRPDAKLGQADSYLGENTTESLILAANEYKEFLTFYPTSPRADYAQYQLGMTHFKQMRSSQRDQTETRAAVLEFQIFAARYPHSSMLAEGMARLREARDRLSTHEYEVGVFYYKTRWYPGAIDRLKTLLKDDPGYTGRDGAYYYLGESLVKVKLGAEALPYFEKLISEFQWSEHLAQAKQRRDELLASLDMKQRPAPAGAEAEKPATSAQTSAQPAPATPKGR